MQPETGPIYLDNAATSWPKPAEVAAAMRDYVQDCGLSVGRSSGSAAQDVADRVTALRQSLADWIGGQSDEVILTSSATDGLNLAIHGLVIQRLWASADSTPSMPVRPWTVLTSRIEHNSVLRPLQSWARRGVLQIQWVDCDDQGLIRQEPLEAGLRQAPWLVCLSQASNVTGVVQELAETGRRCRAQGSLFLIDASQTVGHLPVNVQTLNCDLMVASGHKALLGPLGTGVLYVRRGIQEQVDSLRLGGTGSLGVDLDEVPDSPQKWEAGNLNLPGLLGLAAALAHLEAIGWQNQQQRVNQLCSRLWQALEEIPGLHLVADPGQDPFRSETARVPIISLTTDLLAPHELALALETVGGIVTRAGHHCAPLIHPALRTAPDGTLRISPGPFTTDDQIDQLVRTINMILRF